MKASVAFWGGWGLWCLGLMHFFMHNPGGSALYLPFNAWAWVFLSLMLGMGLWHATQNSALRYSRLNAYWALCAMLLLLPFFWSDSPIRDYAVPRMLGVIGGGGLLFSLYQWGWSCQNRRRLLFVLLGAVTVEMLLGLVQFYLLSPGNWLGYDTRANRPYGIFQQPNVMASFMATGLALALWLDSPSASRLTRLWLGCVMVGTSLLLIVLQSRVGQLGGVLLLLLLLPYLRHERRVCRSLLPVILGGVVGGISLYGGEGMHRGLEAYQSGGMRSIYWPYAWHLILEKPLSGWGFGSFEVTFLQQYMADKALNPAMPQIEYNLDHPHNELLYWGIEGGLLPMLGIIGMGLLLLWRLRSQRWSKRLALLALVTPIALHTQTEYPFYHSIAHWIVFLTLIWYIDEECETADKPQICVIAYPHTLLLRFLALGIPLVVVPFMLTALHTAWVVTKYERGGYKQPELLLQIINPVAWLNRVEFDVNTVRFGAAMQRRDLAELRAYVQWGSEFVRHTPRSAIYGNMVTALRMLGEKAQAEQLRRDALLLYPQDASLLGAASAASGAVMKEKR